MRPSTCPGIRTRLGFIIEYHATWAGKVSDYIFLKKGREAREQDANTLIREEDTQMEMNGNE